MKFIYTDYGKNFINEIKSKKMTMEQVKKGKSNV